MSFDLFTTFGERVRMRVNDVLDNRDCQWPASEDEKSLLGALLGTRGMHRAIPREVLAKRLRISDRALRDMVNNLRTNFGVQIGSSRIHEGGYYLMDDEAECLAASQQMIGQGVAIIRAGIAMRGGKQGVVELLGQINLVLETELREGSTR